MPIKPRFKVAKTHLIANFPPEEQLLAEAGQILAVLAECEGKTIAEVEESLPRVETSREFFVELLAELGFDDAADFTDERARYFSTAQALRETCESYEEFQLAAAKELGKSWAEIEGCVFGDLPTQRRLTWVPPLTPADLVARFRIGQYQRVLAESLQLRLLVESSDIGLARGILRQVRFHGLSAYNNGAGQSSNALIEVCVEGPAAILGQSRIYSRRFSALFKDLMRYSGWSGEAVVRWKKGTKILRLNDWARADGRGSGKVGFVPEEVQQLAKLFASQESSVTVESEPVALTMTDGELIVPDLVLRNDKGDRYAVEIFHPWHQGPLLRRGQQTLRDGNMSLIFGIAAGLLKKTGVGPALEKSENFRNNYFTFKDLPTRASVLECLERHRGASERGNLG
jgi:predicted nuclease of restriction endonuclease-like RecB superfamily